MMRQKVVYVPCTFSRGAFPHERTFVIPFPDGWEYRGTVSAEFCYHLDRTPIGDDPAGDAEVDGMMAGIHFADNDDDTARIELPDGEVYHLRHDQFISVYN